MDLADAEMRANGVDEAVATAVDVPPGVMLFAPQLNLLKNDWLEPFAYLWPTLDAEQSRSGPGMSTTRFVGIRYTGERTSVTEFKIAAIRMARSDRAGVVDDRGPVSGPVFIRSLRKDVSRWAVVPPMADDPGATDRPAPLVRAPENVGAHIGSLTRVTELDGADELYDQAERILLRDHPGYLPRTDGEVPWLAQSEVARKVAAANQRQLRTGLSAEGIRGNIRQAATSDGYSIVLVKEAGYGRSAEYAVVRVRARFGYFDATGTWAKMSPPGRPGFPTASWTPTRRKPRTLSPPSCGSPACGLASIRSWALARQPASSTAGCSTVSRCGRCTSSGSSRPPGPRPGSRPGACMASPSTT